MLPGFRFVLAAIALSISMLVFGLGAAALLRAAHEEFASLPLRRAPAEMLFAQSSDASRPELSLLRVDTPAIDAQGSVTLDIAGVPPESPSASKSEPRRELVSTTSEPVAASANAVTIEPAPQINAAVVAKPEPVADTIAAVTAVALPDDIASPEASIKSDAPKSEAPAPEAPAAEAMPQAALPVQPVDSQIAAISQAAPKVEAAPPVELKLPAPEITPAASAQIIAPIDAATKPASTTIATLGGPAVTIEQPSVTGRIVTPKPVVRPTVKKLVQAQRVVQRRRIAPRARAVRQAPPRPAATSPFGLPFGS